MSLRLGKLCEWLELSDVLKVQFLDGVVYTIPSRMKKLVLESKRSLLYLSSPT